MSSPPLLVSFDTVDSVIGALSESVAEEYASEIRDCVVRGLPPVVSRRVLAVLWGISPRFAGRLVSGHPNLYRQFQIKTGKKKRKIAAPRIALKVIQRWLLHHLREGVELRPDCFGVAKDRSAFDAAMLHCKAYWTCSVDVADFFPSVSKEAVARVCKELGYSDNTSELIAGLCSLSGRLPQGAPTSPLFAHLAFADADAAFAGLAQEIGATYTRYVDDITFSGPESLVERARQLPNELEQILSDHGWEAAEHKTHLAISPQRRKVHGLLVHGRMPRLTKGYRNRLRAFRHLMEQGRVSDDDVHRVAGHLAYAEYISRRREE